MAYTPDKEFNKNSDNRYYNDERYAKSYTFYINPRFEVEKQVTVVVWVIDDLEKAKPFLFVEPSNLSGYQRQQDGTTKPFPYSGNKSLTVSFFNLPKINPKNGNQLKDNNRWYFKVDTEPTKPNISFETPSYYALQERYDKGEEKEKSKPTNTDLFIDYALWTAETFYKGAIYQLPLSGEQDRPKFKLPENDVKFTQTPSRPETTGNQAPESATQSGTQSSPVPNGTYIFDVQKKGFFVIQGQPELKLVTEQDLKSTKKDDFQNLDEEYVETESALLNETAEQSATNQNLQSDIPLDTPKSNMDVPTENINFNDGKFTGGAWKAFDITKAIDAINKTKHGPKSNFRESLKQVLYFIKNDPEIKDIREASYLLGTAFAESSYSLQRYEADYVCGGVGVPYGQGGPCQNALNYFRSTKGGKKNYYDLGVDSKGQPYFGRGLIQLTGKANYEKYGKLIGVDLVSNGDLAMIPINSYKIASVYMRGRTFKFVKSGDLTSARKSVNGGTKGIEEVNGAYNDWVKVISDLTPVA